MNIMFNVVNAMAGLFGFRLINLITTTDVFDENGGRRIVPTGRYLALERRGS